MTRNGLFPVLLVLALATGASADDARTDFQPQDAIVHEAETEIAFHRKCADADPCQR